MRAAADPVMETGPAPRPDRLLTLTKRSQFLAAAKGQWTRRKGLVVQALPRGPNDADGAIRVGYTCSKKVGNAVARNRAKRRLREAARLTLPSAGRPGWDYVLIGKREATVARDFTLLCEDLRSALQTLHQPVKSK